MLVLFVNRLWIVVNCCCLYLTVSHCPSQSFAVSYSVSRSFSKSLTVFRSCSQSSLAKCLFFFVNSLWVVVNCCCLYLTVFYCPSQSKQSLTVSHGLSQSPFKVSQSLSKSFNVSHSLSLASVWYADEIKPYLLFVADGNKRVWYFCCVWCFWAISNSSDINSNIIHNNENFKSLYSLGCCFSLLQRSDRSEFLSQSLRVCRISLALHLVRTFSQ
jgi:hypothetical protein